MAYILKDDYINHISLNHLDQILKQAVEGSSKKPDAIRLESELMAQSEITSFLSGKYKIEDEFTIDATVDPDSRNRLIKMCVLDISIYYMFKTVNPRDVPESRMDSYMNCLDRLEKYRDEELNFGLPIVDDDNDGEPDIQRISLNYNRKFISRPFSDSQIIDPDE